MISNFDRRKLDIFYIGTKAKKFTQLTGIKNSDFSFSGIKNQRFFIELK